MRRFVLLALIVVMGCSFFGPEAMGKDYYLYDREENQISYMSDSETSFTKSFSMEKKPKCLWRTFDPEKYLVIFDPDVDDRNSENNHPGQMLIFNTTTGRSEDLIDLGYLPYWWQYTKDGKHFFIAYKPKTDSKQLELLHYNVEEMKSEKFTDFAAEIYDLILSNDESKLLALIKKENQNTPEFVSLSYAPLGVKTTLPVDKYPEKIYNLSNELAIVACVDRRTIRERETDAGIARLEEGSIQLINLSTSSIIKTEKIQPKSTYLRWYEKERVLIVVAGNTSFTGFGIFGSAEIFKVSAEGIKHHQIKRGWIDYDYLPEKDRLYILTQKSYYNGYLNIVDFANNSVKEYKTGKNAFVIQTGTYTATVYTYSLFHFPGTPYEIIACPLNGNIRFFDIGTNKLKGEIKGVNTFFSSANNDKIERFITISPNLNKYNVLYQTKKEISIYDQSFKELKVIKLKEKPLGIYQIMGSSSQSVVATEKNLYLLDNDNDTLNPIHQFTEEAKEINFYDGGNKIIVWSDKELLVIDAMTSGVTSHLDLWSKSSEKFKKLKAGEQRYYFLRDL